MTALDLLRRLESELPCADVLMGLDRYGHAATLRVLLPELIALVEASEHTCCDWLGEVPPDDPCSCDGCRVVAARDALNARADDIGGDDG